MVVQYLVLLYKYFFNFNPTDAKYIIINPFQGMIISNTYLFRVMLSKLLVPQYLTYEQLYLWPRDADGNILFPDDFDFMILFDNLFIIALAAIFTFTFTMLYSLFNGVMSGSLYIDRIKQQKFGTPPSETLKRRTFWQAILFITDEETLNLRMFYPK